MAVSGLVDTHCHLCDDAFKGDLDKVYERALGRNVRCVIVATEEFADFEKALVLRNKYPSWINICFGIHPVQRKLDAPGQFRSVTLKDMNNACDYIMKNSDLLVGIGEVGLDFTPTLCPTKADQDVQRSIFSTHIKMARQLDLPLNVHSRSASKATLELLKAEGATRVQLHAFDGRPSQALEAVGMGYYLSVPPCVLRSKQKQEVVKAVPLDHLLLETDSPLLGVTGKERNEPGEVALVCDFIAETKNVDKETVIRMTTENAVQLYRKLTFKL